MEKDLASADALRFLYTNHRLSKSLPKSVTSSYLESVLKRLNIPSHPSPVLSSAKDLLAIEDLLLHNRYRRRGRKIQK